MKKIDSVISLIQTLSKAEKKHFHEQVIKDGSDKDFLSIYYIVTKGKVTNGSLVKSEFYKLKPKGSFEISVHYLFEKLTDNILMLRKNKDIYYDLFQNISKARMLYERSLFHECFDILTSTIKEARAYQHNELLIMATKLELECLLQLNFPNISEQELYHKHFIQNEALKKMRKIIEQSSLFNLLKYRLSHKGYIRTEKQKKDMNDLMVNELYIAASSDPESDFEITKNHKLFQANYLISVGDYSAALASFKEMNRLFEANLRFWANPPIYYLSVLEGVLDSLRTVRDYDDMPYFLNKLRLLAKNASLEFKTNVLCLVFQYELFPHLDKGDFAMCLEIIEKYKESLYNKESSLSPIRQSELALYTSLVYIGCHDYKKARKYISRAMLDHNVDYLPIMRTIRLVRLIAYYELGDFDMIEYESRSIKRGLSLKKEKSFKTEYTILWFLNKQDLPVLMKDREIMYEKLVPEMNELHKDKFENQLLRIFDFTAWMESKLLKKSLSDVLSERVKQKFGEL